MYLYFFGDYGVGFDCGIYCDCCIGLVDWYCGFFCDLVDFVGVVVGVNCCCVGLLVFVVCVGGCVVFDVLVVFVGWDFV